MLEPWIVFVAAFILASLCGLARFLHEPTDLTLRKLFSNWLLFGCIGLLNALAGWGAVATEAGQYVLIASSGGLGLLGDKAMQILGARHGSIKPSSGDDSPSD